MMARLVLTLVVCTACDGEPAPAGPVLTALMQTQLSAFAPACEVQPASDPGVVERRICKGSNITVTVALGKDRRLRAVDVVIIAQSVLETKTRLEPTIRGVASPAAVAAAVSLLGTSTTPTTLQVDGTAVTVVSAGSAGFNTYTVGLRY
ncbi:MAG: hypothetical protein M3680_13550 [Myxococcota bacterium]|nr:hypothetical protein [Myxococcota bacterium]